MSWLKNILLVYPEIPSNTYWSFKYALKFINKKSSLPPLGIITTAALIPDGYNLRVVDMNVEPLRSKDIEWADAVFISAMIIQKESMESVISMCRTKNRPVVAGGPYPTASHEKIPGVDHFVLGEAEDIFQDFFADFENGRADKVYYCSRKPQMKDSVIPRFDLLKMKKYSSMSVQYSRGCPFKCEFCDIWTVYGNKPRLKSADSILSELEFLSRLGWKGAVFMVDDNFIGNKYEVKTSLLPALIAWQGKNRHRFSFYTEASINMASDHELMRMMRQAGFDQVFIGIETPSREALSETGKIQNLKCDLEEAVQTIQSYGFEVMGGFIIGFDSDSEDIFDRQISFIQKTGIPKAMVGLLNALPGTKLYKRLEEEGRIQQDSLGNNTHSLETNFSTKLDKQVLKDGYARVLASIYDANLKNYFTRCNTLLDKLKHTCYKKRQIRFKEIKAFLKSLAIQPFAAYGWQYIKFVSRNLVKNYKIFGEAVTFAIMGHHFHKITRETIKANRVSASLDDIYKKFRHQMAQYSESIRLSSGESLSHLNKAMKHHKKRLKKVRKRIRTIHKDFRQEVVVKYNDVSESTKQKFADTKRRLARTANEYR